MRRCAHWDNDMSWFTRKKEAPERAHWREQFESAASGLRRADLASQVAVGHSINLANSLMLERFGTLDAFRALPKPEKLEYLDKIAAMKDDLSQRDPHAALGFILYGMWLATVVEDDVELSDQFAAVLATYSRKGDIGV